MAGQKRTGLATGLLGMRISPRSEDEIGRKDGPWPVNAPNLSGQHFANIQAAWVQDGAVKILAVTPGGVAFETWATIVTIEPEPA